ncbi:MAG: SGNH/GDSL hydrolase family protein [Armatimonadia bacterium]
MLRFALVVSSVLLAISMLSCQPASDPPQVPLCMIGDSITWAGEGDYWRKYLLEDLPNLAFVGTHTAVLGYSHAGEGGNSTGAVLARMDQIPDCANYHVLIGTNDGRSPDEEKQKVMAQACADRIIKIVQGLLQKPSVQHVFLGSILPCQTDDPNRDITNSRVNAILRPQIKTLFPEKVVWIEYEQPIRAIENWGPMILLHPTKPGYQVIAKLTADAIRAELGLPEKIDTPRPAPGAGVRIENLWADGKTTRPIIAGWYTMSFDVKTVDPAGGTLILTGEGTDPKKTMDLTFKIPADSAGKRLSWNLMTGYAGYGYTTGYLTAALQGCELDRILFEKTRPSGKASIYGQGSYLDAVSPWSPGELLEK